MGFKCDVCSSYQDHVAGECTIGGMFYFCDKCAPESLTDQLSNTPGEVVHHEGLKFDNNKPQLDLVPSSLIDAVGDILTMGAKKYTAQNWRKGLKYTRVIAALMRHLNAWREGDSIDKESGKSHMWHVACNVAFLIEFEANPEKYKDFDDRWIK